MVQEQRRTVVTDQYVDPAPSTVVEQPGQRVITEPAPAAYVNNRDPVGNSLAASQLIQTVVWSAVVIVLLVVGILVLLHYNII